jgi:hypothetical protein
VLLVLGFFSSGKQISASLSNILGSLKYFKSNGVLSKKLIFLTHSALIFDAVRPEVGDRKLFPYRHGRAKQNDTAHSEHSSCGVV